jgi:hypothetical protein
VKLENKLSRRSLIVIALFAAVLVLFIAEVAALSPGFMDFFIHDYDSYVLWGNTQRLSFDQCAPQAANYYPLPSTLWIFAPLSMFPRWFAFVFMFAPFIFLLPLFKKDSGIAWLFFPLWVQTGNGQIDGWLILPLYWLIQNTRWLAGIGAVLVLFKPQIAIFAVGYMIIHWFTQRNWRNLGAFAIYAGDYLHPLILRLPNLAPHNAPSHRRAHNRINNGDARRNAVGMDLARRLDRMAVTDCRARQHRAPRLRFYRPPKTRSSRAYLWTTGDFGSVRFKFRHSAFDFENAPPPHHPHDCLLGRRRD